MPDENTVFATSNPMQISFVLDAILQLNPSSVLDIGCGSGKYGVLLREYLPKARLDGIEGFAPYVTDVHRTVYDNIYTAGAIETVEAMKHGYDLTILIDVLEHFTLGDGMKLLTLLKTRSQSVLVSVPVWHPIQEAIHGNALQEHRAQYDAQMLRRLHFNQILRVSGNYIALASKRKIRLRGKATRCAATALLPEWGNRLLAPISRKLSK